MLAKGNFRVRGGRGGICGHATPVALRQRSRRDMTNCNAAVAKPICLRFKILQIAAAFASYHIEVVIHLQTFRLNMLVHVKTLH